MGEQEATLGTEYLMPWEKQGGSASPADVDKSLRAVAESELSDDPPKRTKPAASEADEVEDAEPDVEEASDEGESEESSEGASEDEEADDEQDDVESQGPESRKHHVRADGKDHEMTYDELVRHASLGLDYTRKSQDVAAERRQAETEIQALRGAREQYGERLNALSAALADLAPKAPDWDKLRQENPAEYSARWADHLRHKEKVQEVEAERQKILGEQETDRKKQYGTWLAQEAKLLDEALPEWRTQDVAEKEQGKIRERLLGLGFTDETLGALGHKLLIEFRKAMLYDEGQTKGKEKIREKIKSAGPALKPGARDANAPQRTKNKVRQRAMDQLARSGRVDDAAHVIKGLLDSE